tara:strand:+ start:1109 stop:1456 length:348 start_codon:yes stop_codon:yes gene_type:complete
MTEKQYEDALVALGCKDVTSKTQKKNGTTAFRMPDGKNMITEHVTGYIRRTVLSETGRVASCYQLNPQYQTPYKVVNQYGELCEWNHNKRTLLMSRKTRLKKLFLYTIKAVNNEG